MQKTSFTVLVVIGQRRLGRMLPVITVKTLLTRSIFAESETEMRATSQVMGHPPRYKYQWGRKMSGKCVIRSPFAWQHCSPTCSLSFSTRSPWGWFLKSVRSEISESSNQKSAFWASRASILILKLAATRPSYPTYLLQLDGKEVNFSYSPPSSKIVALMRTISNEWMNASFSL